MTPTYNTKDFKICVVGLGYVGLPLLLKFSEHFDVAGLDNSKTLITSLKNGIDRTSEADSEALALINKEIFKSRWSDLTDCNVYICTVPTPVNDDNSPDLTALIDFCDSMGQKLKRKDTIVFESTVYPGVTEEVCVPILEKLSGLKAERDFSVGYSPERISPGDNSATLAKVTKVVSGLDWETTQRLSWMYSLIIEADVYKAPSIKVAEAAKILENTQRDVNIALMNEVSKLFHQLNIDTWEVLEAASTKWNFHNYHPGLVGGHCIGIDPYYLVHKGAISGVSTDLVLQARLINEGIVNFIIKEVLRTIAPSKTPLSEFKILILGLTFKADVSDIRNSKILDLIDALLALGCKIDAADPHLSSEVNDITSINQFLTNDSLKIEDYDIVFYAVNHKKFSNVKEILNNSNLSKVNIFDLTGTLEKYSWRL